MVYLLLGKKSQKWFLSMYKNSGHYLKTLDGESYNSTNKTRSLVVVLFLIYSKIFVSDSLLTIIILFLSSSTIASVSRSVVSDSLRPHGL